MSVSGRMGRHSLVYGASILLTQALGFLLVPLYTRMVTPAEYGILEVLNRTSEALGIVLLAGLRLTLIRFVQDPQFGGRRGEVVGSAMAVVGGLALLAALSLAWQAEAVATLLFRNRELAWAVRLLAAGMGADLLTILPMALLQADQRSTRFAAMNVSRFVIALALNLALVAWWRLGLKGILLATAVSASAQLLALQWGLWSSEKPTLSRPILSEMLRFGMPFVPGGLFLFILNNGDRYFLVRFAPPAELGVYALGYKLGTLVMFLLIQPVIMNWNTMIVEISAREDGPRLFARAYLLVAAAYLCLGTAYALLAPELLGLLVGPEYRAAASLIPLVVLAYFFYSSVLFLDTPFYLARKTGAKPLILAASALLCIVLYRLWIPTRGSVGALWATCVSFAFFAWLTWSVSRRHYDIPYAWGRVGAFLGTAVGVVLGAQAVHTGRPELDIPIRLALALAFPVGLWTLGLAREERASVQAAVHGAIRPLREAFGAA